MKTMKARAQMPVEVVVSTYPSQQKNLPSWCHQKLLLHHENTKVNHDLFLVMFFELRKYEIMNSIVNNI